MITCVCQIKWRSNFPALFHALQKSPLSYKLMLRMFKPDFSFNINIQWFFLDSWLKGLSEKWLTLSLQRFYSRLSSWLSKFLSAYDNLHLSDQTVIKVSMLCFTSFKNYSCLINLCSEMFKLDFSYDINICDFFLTVTSQSVPTGYIPPEQPPEISSNDLPWGSGFDFWK